MRDVTSAMLRGAAVVLKRALRRSLRETLRETLCETLKSVVLTEVVFVHPCCMELVKRSMVKWGWVKGGFHFRVLYPSLMG